MTEQPQGTEPLVSDGWHKVTRPLQPDDFEKVVDGHVDYGDGASVESCIDWGCAFEPAICMTLAAHQQLEQRIATLQRELAAVLDVAIARGERLDYDDDDYCKRYLELTGRDWREGEGE